MQLKGKDLVAEKTTELLKARQKLSQTPGLALVWIGNDEQTGAFVRAKQKKAQDLKCDFFLHHLEQSSERQLEALILGLNNRKDIHGIVLQLPLPEGFKTELIISLFAPEKDIDGLMTKSRYPSPTPTGIIELLRYHNIVITKAKTVIIGAGRLVGQPLADIFQKNHWPYTLITSDAAKHAEEIKGHDILISATGVTNLVTPAMVHKDMIVVDGSGVDVDVERIEPLVKAVTPKKGAIGPLTVCFLFDNLLSASR